MQSASPRLRLSWPDDALLASFAEPMPCLSSAALNGGLTVAEHWMALQVGAGPSPSDDQLRLAEAALGEGLDPLAVVGCTTVADVRAGVRRDHRPATAVATVSRDVSVLVALDVGVREAGLVVAAGWAAEAAARGLAAARMGRGPRRESDAGAAGVTICVAAPPGPRTAPVRPSAAVEAAISLAVHSAVRSGARIHRQTVAALGEV